MKNLFSNICCRYRRTVDLPLEAVVDFPVSINHSHSLAPNMTGARALLLCTQGDHFSGWGSDGEASGDKDIPTVSVAFT